MSKLDVLKYNQAFMAWLGIYSQNLLEPTNEFFKSAGSYYIVINLVIALYGSASFAEDYWHVDLTKALGAIKICFAGTQALGLFVNTGLNMSRIKATHLALQQLVDEVNIEARDIYWKCEEKCRKFTITLSCFNIYHLSSCIFTLVKVVWSIASGKIDPSSWYLAFAVSLPIDDTSLFGWSLSFLLQICMANVYALSMTSVTSYFVSCCHYINAMCDHFKFLNPKKIEKNWLKITQTMITAIKVHIQMFDTFYMLSKIFSGTIFVLLPCNAVFLSLVLYDIEQSATNFDLWNLNWNISCLFCCLLWPYLICYFATLVGEQMASIGNVAFDSVWYEYPPQLRTYIILIIARSQEPTHFTGFGLVYCTLEVFGKILKNSCSYYLIFRTMAQR